MPMTGSVSPLAGIGFSIGRRSAAKTHGDAALNTASDRMKHLRVNGIFDRVIVYSSYHFAALSAGNSWRRPGHRTRTDVVGLADVPRMELAESGMNKPANSRILPSLYRNQR